MKNSEKLFNWNPQEKIRIILWDRAIGKTTECIKYLEENPNTNCFVPTLMMGNNYPRHLKKRVFTARNKGRAPYRHQPVIIDNADLIDENTLYNIYQNYNVVLITVGPTTFLQSLMIRDGVDIKINEEYREKNKRFIRW